MKLISKASLQIQKPVNEVFDGIVNPSKMTKYFISESTGKLEEGKELLWKFPEFPDRYPITDIKIQDNSSISFIWDPQTVVSISLESLTDNSTLVKVTEDGKYCTEKNLKWLVENTGGWANFLACLKAYLEYGVQLRVGAYEFMRGN